MSIQPLLNASKNLQTQTQAPILTENHKILLNSIKLKSQEQVLSFSVSDLAILTGYHPYGNIIQTFLKYLYQQLDLLYELDLSFLQIETISVEDEIFRILSKCSTEKQQQIHQFTFESITKTENLQNHQQVKKFLEQSTQLLQEPLVASTTVSASAAASSNLPLPSLAATANVPIDIDVGKVMDQVTKEELEFLQEELSFRIKTNYGKFNEMKALDQYEAIVGFPVVERNENCYVMEVPTRTIDLSSVEDMDDETDQHAVTPVSTEQATEPANGKSEYSTIICIDLCDEGENSITESVLIQHKTEIEADKLPILSDNTPSLLSDNLKREKISDYFLSRTKRLASSLPQPSSTSFGSQQSTQRQETEPSSSSSQSRKKSKRQKKSNSHHSISFCIIGKVDGVSYQMDSSSEDATQWKQYKIIVEIKNRVHRLYNPPPLYEQIQLTAYLIMTGSMYGDLVQVMPEEESEMYECNTESGAELSKNLQSVATTKDESSFKRSTSVPIPNFKSSYQIKSASSLPSRANGKVETEIHSMGDFSYHTPTFSITRVALDGPPYFHRYHWDTVIIPRLHIFKDAIMTLRRDDELRHLFLTSNDEQKLAIIHNICPYFQP